MLGFVCLIVPGLVLLVRWSAAVPAYLVSDRSISGALRWSWRETRPLGAAITITWLMLLGLFVIACTACFALTYRVGAWPTIFLIDVMGSAIQAAGWFLSIEIYLDTDLTPQKIAEIFA